jgi:hypothetical protein
MWGKIIQDTDFIHDLLRDLLGVVVRVVGDVLEDVAEADQGAGSLDLKAPPQQGHGDMEKHHQREKPSTQGHIVQEIAGDGLTEERQDVEPHIGQAFPLDLYR